MVYPLDNYGNCSIMVNKIEFGVLAKCLSEIMDHIAPNAIAF
jgi:hypothetical protein